MLNKQSGNMYPWCDFTWNPIKGICPHACTYCYYQNNPRYKDKIGELRLDEKCLRDKLGKGRTIFIGSSTDMWALGSEYIWIEKVMDYLNTFPDNTYLLQSKDPHRMYLYRSLFPPRTIIGTTAETNRHELTDKLSSAPCAVTRLNWLEQFVENNKMVSMEPIMDFDIEPFVLSIKQAKPLFVSIGADSRNCDLPEPPSGKLKELISELERFTKVKIKKNLNRLLIN